MPKPILVVVGACTATSAKIFAIFDQPIPAEAELTYQVPGSPKTLLRSVLRPAFPFYLCHFELTDLPSSPDGTRIEYSISGSAPASFRLLPTGRPLRIALISCNNAFEILNKKRRHLLWTELRKQIQTGNVDLVIHAGDQVYADGIRLRYRVRDRLFDPLDQTQLEEITSKYRKLYVDCWKVPEVAAVLSMAPSLFMWDDHDIYDGYGSHEDDREPISQLLFRAAHRAFSEFQAIHNPPQLERSSFSFELIHGKTAILVMDQRSHRSWPDHTILGESQLNQLNKWLKQHKNAFSDLYVVSPTPILYIPVAAYLKLIQLIGWDGPLTEDLRDCWTAPNHQAECKRLLDLLFQFSARSPQTRIHLLSGDVHVGAFGKIQNTQNPDVVINQVISSGIGSLPPIGLAGMILRTITEEHVELSGTGYGGTLFPFPGTDDFVLSKRNFAIVSSGPDRLNLRYFVEENDSVISLPCRL